MHRFALDEAHALVMEGERHFDEGDAAAAYEAYLELIETDPDHDLAPFALYKLAWTEYNLGDVEAAVVDMALAVEWGRDSEGMGSQIALEGAKDLERFEAGLDQAGG